MRTWRCTSVDLFHHKQLKVPVLRVQKGSHFALSLLLRISASFPSYRQRAWVREEKHAAHDLKCSTIAATRGEGTGNAGTST